MVEFIPYILVLISWNLDDPEASMQVAHRLVGAHEICESEGKEYVAQRRIYREEFGKMRFSYSCIKAPTEKDLDSLFATGE
jgi:hypothetical protein